MARRPSRRARVGAVTILRGARPTSRPDLVRFVRAVLRGERCPRPVTVVLADDRLLRRLNRRFRGRDRVTDVLAFEGDVDRLGEVCVSLDRVRVQARRYRVTPGQELRRLVAHGLLHLLGYTHRTMRRRLTAYRL